MFRLIGNIFAWILLPILLWIGIYNLAYGQVVITPNSFELQNGVILELSDAFLIKPQVIPGKLKGWMLIRLGKWDSKESQLVFVPVFETPNDNNGCSNSDQSNVPPCTPWWNRNIYSPL